MSESIFTRLESRYAEKSKEPESAIQRTSAHSWNWLSGEQLCVYHRSDEDAGGILAVLDALPEGGSEGKQFVFNAAEIVSVIDVALTREHVERGVGWKTLLEIHLLERMYGSDRAPDEAETELFWQSLKAPLVP